LQERNPSVREDFLHGAMSR